MNSEFGKLYRRNSVPLEEVVELTVGEEYFNKEGHCLKYLGEDKYEFVKQSPLISGELLEDVIDEKVLRLFWILAKNM